MVALHEHGYTVTEIGIALGRDRNTIARIFRENGIVLKTGEGWRKRKLNPVQEIELVRLYEQQISVNELCSRFDVGRTYIYAMLKKYQCVSHAERERNIRNLSPVVVTSKPRLSPSPSLTKTYAIRDRNRQYVWNYYQSHPCVDCNESDPRVLELDHVRGKKVAGVSQLVHNTTSLKRIDEEIAKCEVVCANCHRIRTCDTQGWYSGIETGLTTSSMLATK